MNKEGENLDGERDKVNATRTRNMETYIKSLLQLSFSSLSLEKIASLIKEAEKRGFEQVLAEDNDFHNATKSLNIDYDKLIEKMKFLSIQVITIIDRDYPDLLTHIPEAPPILFVRGDIRVLSGFNLAITGARRCSDYGRITARKFARAMAENGINVVSGMAIGIDTAAMRGALDAEGKTIGVLGNGVDIFYPPSNRTLARKVIENGCLVSEFPPTVPSLPYHFPRRNRIISGLSKGVLVVEASAHSGTFSTVSWALDQGREVFAIPGDITRKQSEGTNLLIKNGAKITANIMDIFEEIGFTPQVKVEEKMEEEPGIDNEEKKIINTIIDNPLTMEAISFKTNLSLPRVSSALVLLEIKGLIKELPGKRYIKI